MSKKVQRGDVVCLDFGKTEVRAIEKKRPALVVQNDIGNQYSPATIVAAIHHEAGKGLPVHVSVPAGVGGLTKASVVDCGILSTIRLSDLGAPIGRLPAAYMVQVDIALKKSLNLK